MNKITFFYKSNKEVKFLFGHFYFSVFLQDRAAGLVENFRFDFSMNLYFSDDLKHKFITLRKCLPAVYLYVIQCYFNVFFHDCYVNDFSWSNVWILIKYHYLLDQGSARYFMWSPNNFQKSYRFPDVNNL